jgi:DNA polymerase-3 subunit gamma/tau
MAYEVLARKYRSRTFDEIVGQKAIATTLRNAIETGRIHHGYLFTGTRGVGKTSMARILAKSLNCFAFDAPTPVPCCKCELCLRVAEGGDLDVVEIDAASNTGVDNIRELRNNAAFMPARARYKMYIIDEVHMLSTGAFNALLKTLEEPPPHVKFVLATTEAHKVPATIKSRCQRFDFRSISPADIAEQLLRILEQEQISAAEDVIRRVSRLANGSMRDALSLLDQLLAYGTRDLTEALMEDLLPTAHDAVIHRLVDALAAGQAADALHCIEESLGAGQTAARFCDMLIEHLRALMLLRVCGPETDLLDVGSAAREQLAAQAQAFEAPAYVYMIALLEEVRRQVRAASAPRALIDAAVVRLTMVTAFTGIDRLLAHAAGAEVVAPDLAAAKKKTEPRMAARSAGPARSVETQQAQGAMPRTLQSTGANRVVESKPSRPVRRGDRAPGVSAEQRSRLMSRPFVRRAVELSGGSIVDVVRRGAEAVADGDDAPAIDNADSTVDSAESAASEGPAS